MTSQTGADWLPQRAYCVDCGRWLGSEEATAGHRATLLPPRVWFYTNYDCNLACRYCLVSSNPHAEPRALGIEKFAALIEEAEQLGVEEVFLTGGEPFMAPDIYSMLALATSKLRTTVLTNGLILRGEWLRRLLQIGPPGPYVQISLDDCRPDVHDAYRGKGTWARTNEAIQRLTNAGIQVRIATTVTPELEPRVDEVRRFVRDRLGIPEEHHLIRPVLKRGFSDVGLEVSRQSLIPELTVDVNGFYWHPAGTDADLSVAVGDHSLRHALEEVALILRGAEPARREAFR